MRRLLALVALFTLLPAGHALAADDGPDDRVVISGPVLVDRDESVQDVFVADGDVLIRGTVRGDVVVIDGNATIRGRVRGDVVTIAGRAILGARARVGGDLLYVDKEPRLLPGARVAGDREKLTGFDSGTFALFAVGFWGALTLSMLVLGLLLLLLAPRAADAVARTGKKSWGISIGVGIGAAILLPIIAGIAFVTLLGIPLGIVLSCLIVVLYALGFVAASLVVGRLMLKKARIGAFVVGLLVLAVLSLLPFVGLLAAIFGIGVLLVTILRARTA